MEKSKRKKEQKVMRTKNKNLQEGRKKARRIKEREWKKQNGRSSD